MKFIEIKELNSNELFVLNIEQIVSIHTQKDDKGKTYTAIYPVECDFYRYTTDEPLDRLMFRIGELLKKK